MYKFGLPVTYRTRELALFPVAFLERKDRLKTETDNLTIITSRLKETFVDGVEKVDKMEDDFKGLMKQSLLISITNMSYLVSLKQP
jgi:hypothetical protein